MKQSSVIRKMNIISKQIPWNDQKIPELNINIKNVASKIDSLVNQLSDSSTNSDVNTNINSNTSDNIAAVITTYDNIQYDNSGNNLGTKDIEEINLIYKKGNTTFDIEKVLKQSQYI